MNVIRWPRGTAICVVIMLMQCVPSAWAVEKLTLWPTIFFLRGQDLCQFQDLGLDGAKQIAGFPLTGTAWPKTKSVFKILNTAQTARPFGVLNTIWH